MESKIEEESLMDALSYSRVTQLGKEWGGRRPWVKAIVKVEKCDNSRNYALAENDGTGKPNITRDFGNCARIVKVLAIYPTYILKDTDTPNLKNKSEIVRYLSSGGYDADETTALLADTDSEGNPKTQEKLAEDQALVKSRVIALAVKTQVKLLEMRYEY